MLKLKSSEKWDDSEGNKYLEIRIEKADACCVKKTKAGLIYVLMCVDGNNVYSDIAGADYPLRKLTAEEYESIISFAKEEFAKDNSMISDLNAVSPADVTVMSTTGD